MKGRVEKMRKRKFEKDLIKAPLEFFLHFDKRERPTFRKLHEKEPR